ncbi:hypothetical protein [Streptomyces sp. TSRI0281]|uniref:hypothetical protein n=2 Tax=unclassified Streptomyces TaxID=2593676 RepID=UPI000AA286D0|nr:hypothetical protein [Streptomyces sp. TSRI0281]
MTYPMATAGKAAALAVVEATRALELALHYAGSSCDLEQSIEPGGCRLRLTPAPALPWLLGDVQGNLLSDRIIAAVTRIEQPLPCPGPDLVIEPASTQDIRALGRLVESSLTEVQKAALQLHRAFARSGFERRVGVQNDVIEAGVIEASTFDTEDATHLYRILGGDELALCDLDLSDWRDHERFATHLQKTMHTATGRPLLVESRPTCGHCRDQHGGNRIRIDFLDTDDALALAAALKAPNAPVGPILTQGV